VWLHPRVEHAGIREQIEQVIAGRAPDVGWDSADRLHFQERFFTSRPAWSHHWMTDGNHRVRAMVDARLADREDRAARPYRVDVIVHFRNTGTDGEYLPEERDDLRDLEERLVIAVERGRRSLLAGLVNPPGRTDLIFYTSSPESVEEAIAAFRAGGLSHEMTVETTNDENWSRYTTLLTWPQGIVWPLIGTGWA
jgi:uncharacterized protein DUF695